MNNALKRTVARLLLAGCIAGAATAETNNSADQNKPAQSSTAKTEKRAKKAKKPKQSQPEQTTSDNNLYWG